MANPFSSKRRAWWIGGVALLVFGFLAIAVIVPLRAPVPGADGPEVQVPKMQNIPAEGAPKLKLDVAE